MLEYLKDYPADDYFDEAVAENNTPRTAAKPLLKQFENTPFNSLQEMQSSAEVAIANMGISFTVYSDKGNIDRLWPFDVFPRTLCSQEWKQISDGLKQRLKALNRFIEDVYNERQIFQAGIMPEAIITSSKDFRPECCGMKLKHNSWASICGSDLVRDVTGKIYVLEDNLRVPSGVSYMLENRAVMKQVMPEVFNDMNILPVDQYPMQLLSMLRSLCPYKTDNPEVVVLTPGIFNSAYYEHAYLAHEMGAELVEGSDLVVLEDNCVYMRNIEGLKRVDVIYRRIDDAFLDPEVFREDSTLGVPGLMRAWKAGKVAIANAPGCGVADDKVVYAYVPDMIRFYLDEEPLIENVPTYLCSREEERNYVLEHLQELVVKPANESGGYGLLIGPKASAEEIETFRQLIQENPRNYIAQPTLNISTVPTVCDQSLEPRHVDLRPFILLGEKSYVTAGGLTRVALKKGSLVVNSSQGGGSKDTWIVVTEEEN
ncbi:circularly permuted type 2 ATP-grasp protein [Thiomicrorhabdus sp. 6S3-12]|uniref:circularly permuted type 2 ATP-grasp protein n=1 Tax=Thiomicrorhabdus sp. 6S3-12 TaxID=2819681 RepID=UPI001AACA5C5|nr:circularly permuted type 2 ATP-grasp protein [Thiomicrorhabdus sp. 6S3-12]MBO1924667.1 circularly permuted type 2 ATP-grasp protein [Thiomicrorhabdus sp. 6S3-12]